MKTTGRQLKNSNASAEIKLRCTSLETLKPSKQRCRTSGNGKAESSSDPSTAQIGLVQTHPPDTAPSNSASLTCQSSNALPKFKLQLFPIDEATQKSLQQDKHNPYLELILASRKKISSVVNHLNIKWGSSKYAKGELRLFPYNAGPDDSIGFRSWSSKDTDTTAADVYAMLGSPAKFRLRYGWIFNHELTTCRASLVSLPFEDNFMTEHAPMDANKPSLDNDLGAPVVLNNSAQAVDNQNEAASLSWIDCISNMSFGALLSKAEALPSPDGKPLPSQKNLSTNQIPLSCDSFDAAIASFIARQQVTNQSTKPSRSSFWEAEETCNAFQFQNFSSSRTVSDVALDPLKQPMPCGSLDVPTRLSNPMTSDGDGAGLDGSITSSMDAFQNFSIF